MKNRKIIYLRDIFRFFRLFSLCCFLSVSIFLVRPGLSLAGEQHVIRVFQTWCIVDDAWKEGIADTVSKNSADPERERCLLVAKKLVAKVLRLPRNKRYQFIKNACMSAPGSYTSGDMIMDEMRRVEQGVIRGKTEHCDDQAQKLIAALAS